LARDDRLDVRRLAIVLGQLQSTHDHEVLNAARAATRMVREAGTTWAAVLNGLAADPDLRHQIILHDERGPLTPPVGDSWADAVRWLSARRAGATWQDNDRLDELSRRLHRAFRGERPDITPNQAAWVIDIYDARARPTSFPREEIA
jgi:hypothetical protein